MHSSKLILWNKKNNECYMIHQFCSFCLSDAGLDTPRPWIIKVDEAVSCEWFFQERWRWLIKELSSTGLSTRTHYKVNLSIDYSSRMNQYFTTHFLCVFASFYEYGPDATVDLYVWWMFPLLIPSFLPHPLPHIEKINHVKHNIRFTFIDKKKKHLSKVVLSTAKPKVFSQEY